MLSKSAKIRTAVFAFAASAILSVSAIAGPNDSVWTQLFNPKDTSLRTNWDIKVRKSALNVDTRNTFRYGIANGDTFIDVNYSNWTTYLDGSDELHSHMGYKIRPFSYYLLRGEYMVMSTARPASSPSWANQNNGFMLHSQSVASMNLNQDFPASLEAQLLGPANTTSGGGSVSASTMNLCTPGTGFSTTPTGTTSSTHCIPSRQGLARAATGAWQKVSALILGDSIHTYYAGPNGTDSAITYYKPVYLSGGIASPSTLPANNTRLTGGYITIQGESAPYRFRRIDVLNLEGCMTPSDVNYKTYFVKHDTAACNKPAGVLSRADIRGASPMTFIGNSVKVGGQGMVTLEVFDVRGARVARHTAQAPFQWTPSVKQAGMHVLRAITPKGTYTEKATLF
jgi:hypothetical protein